MSETSLSSKTISDGILYLNKISDHLDDELLLEHAKIMQSFQELSRELEKSHPGKLTGKESYPSKQKLCKRPKRLPFEKQFNKSLEGKNTVKLESNTSHKELNPIHEITMLINDQEVGQKYCTVSDEKIVISKELDGPSQYVLSLIDYNIPRVNGSTLYLTSHNTTIELNFKTELSCHQFHTLIDSYNQLSIKSLNIEIYDNESFCGYGSSESYSTVGKMNRSFSIDHLQTELKSPQYDYPRFATNTEKRKWDLPSRKNLPLNSLKFRRKISGAIYDEIYNVLTVFNSPVNENVYAKVLDGPCSNAVSVMKEHIYDTIVD